MLGVLFKRTCLLSLESRDAPELRLSKTQLKVFDEWKRAEDALPPPAWLVNEVDRGRLGPTMTAAKGIDLVQDAATDCSVVASLCSGVARGERGHATVSIFDSSIATSI